MYNLIKENLLHPVGKRDSFMKKWKVGVDVVLVPRVERSLSSHPSQFFRRFFTERELSFCSGPRKIQRLSGRIAAKEAVMKVLGDGWPRVPWVDIEILPGDNAQPLVYLNGKAKALLEKENLGTVEVSITHDGDVAVAVALGIPREAFSGPAGESLHSGGGSNVPGISGGNEGDRPESSSHGYPRLDPHGERGKSPGLSHGAASREER